LPNPKIIIPKEKGSFQASQEKSTRVQVSL